MTDYKSLVAELRADWRKPDYKPAAMETAATAIEELSGLVVRLKTQLNAAYGCESCPGIPTLTNPDVARMAFRAVFWDRPEYFKD